MLNIEQLNMECLMRSEPVEHVLTYRMTVRARASVSGQLGDSVSVYISLVTVSVYISPSASRLCLDTES